MAGDDEAGAEFAKRFYKSAAGTTLDKRGSRSGRCGIVPLRLGGARNTPNSPENAYQLRTAGYAERKIPLLPTSQSKFKASDCMRPPEGYMIDSKYVLGQYNDAMTANKEIRGLEIVTNDEDATACWQTLIWPKKASEFLLWLRDHYLPSPGIIRYTTEDAVEQGLQTDGRVPAVGSALEIKDELEQHLRVVTA
ncbi:restriction endonuclease fold toxin-2 domain-containing protein [Streptomyces sp. cg35]|uniref:restriction endonuclease fold toxin-2 domain-containing protein n=1 Tax=Streptomyces sp. cg35 TaxID=3421650 RepID=UPI003D16FCD0